MDGLIATFFSDLFPLRFACHKGHLLRIGYLTFEISHKRLDINVLMASIEYRTNNDHRLSPLRLGKLLEPWTDQHFVDHGLSNQL